MDFNLSALTNDKPVSTADLVTEALRTAIWQGKLKSNQPLRQDKIAAEFGVSKIPIREALFQLKAEGLVTTMFNRGLAVSELSPAEIEEIYTMRIALETVALQRAISSLTKADFVHAVGLITIADEEQDPAQWVVLDWEFHATLYRAANMPHLIETIRMLYINVSRYIAIYLAELDYQAQSQHDHRVLLKACRKRDIDKAVACHTQHLKAASERLISFLRQQA